MRKVFQIIAAGMLITIAVAGPATAAPDSLQDQASAFFKRYVELGHAFDVAVADMYADDARIISIRKYPSGEERTVEMTGSQLKDRIREVMPMARARGDKSTYSNVSYAVEGSRVRINATRYSVLKNYYSPYSMLIGPDSSGRWLIYELKIVAQP